MGGWVGGRSSLSLRSVENECSWEGVAVRERKRRLVGGRDPIHCVVRIFAGYPIAWKVSAVPFRLSIVLWDFYCLIPQHRTLPVISPSRLLRGMFLLVILFVFTLSLPKSTRLFFFSFHMESPSYLKSRRKHLNFTVVKHVLYTCLRWDGLVSVREMSTHSKRINKLGISVKIRHCECTLSGWIK